MSEVPEETTSLPRLLTGAEVAARFRVTPKTVARWASQDPPLLTEVRTPGNHRRFYEDEVNALLRLKRND